ncbi:hypothetical protein TNCV_1593831 [Trichonephila clavipes]|nr:hypothetical protein TNCV_1593831 [Trichonephila clavipes]
MSSIRNFSTKQKYRKEKTIQLAPSTRKPKPLQEKNNSTQQEKKHFDSTGRNNSTRYQERNNSTQQEKTTQLGSRNETTQLCFGVHRLEPPSAPGTKQLDSTLGNNSTRHQERNNSTQQEKTT